MNIYAHNVSLKCVDALFRCICVLPRQYPNRLGVNTVVYLFSHHSKLSSGDGFCISPCKFNGRRIIPLRYIPTLCLGQRIVEHYMQSQEYIFKMNCIVSSTEIQKNSFGYRFAIKPHFRPPFAIETARFFSSSGVRKYIIYIRPLSRSWLDTYIKEFLVVKTLLSSFAL